MAAYQTQFGVKINVNSTPDICTLADKLGVDLIRVAITLKTFNGKDSQTDKMLNNGKYVALTLNWGDVGRDAEGNKVPVPFPTNMENYKNKLRPVLRKYGNNAKVIMLVCENEPTTKNFHSGPMSDYLTELRNFVQVCKEEGCNAKSTAGAVHVELVKSVMNDDLNDETSEGKAADVKTLLNGYKDINFKYLNFHTSASGSSYPKNQIVDTANWALPYTNKTACTCDEWHIETFSNQDAAEQMTAQIIQNMKDAGYIHSVYISGTGNDEGLLNEWDTYNLTRIGQTYKEKCPVPITNPDLERLKEIWETTREGISLVGELNPDVLPQCGDVIDAGDALVNNAATFDFNYLLVDLDGRAVRDEDGNYINVGRALSFALLLAETSESPDKIFAWSQALHAGEALTISPDDVKLLIRLVLSSDDLSVLLKERILQKLEPGRTVEEAAGGELIES